MSTGQVLLLGSFFVVGVVAWLVQKRVLAIVSFTCTLVIFLLPAPTVNDLIVLGRIAQLVIGVILVHLISLFLHPGEPRRDVRQNRPR